MEKQVTLAELVCPRPKVSANILKVESGAGSVKMGLGDNADEVQREEDEDDDNESEELPRIGDGKINLENLSIEAS